MNRRAFVAGSLGLFASRASEAQQTDRVYRVGLVSLAGDLLWWQPVLEALRNLKRELKG